MKPAKQLARELAEKRVTVEASPGAACVYVRVRVAEGHHTVWKEQDGPRSVTGARNVAEVISRAIEDAVLEAIGELERERVQ
jgi:hypothetical protein